MENSQTPIEKLKNPFRGPLENARKSQEIPNKLQKYQTNAGVLGGMAGCHINGNIGSKIMIYPFRKNGGPIRKA